MQLLKMALSVSLATGASGGTGTGQTADPLLGSAAATVAVVAPQEAAVGTSIDRARFEQLLAVVEQRKSEGLDSGNWAPALLAANQLLEFTRAKFAKSSSELSDALLFVGLILKFQGRFLEAEPYWTESVRIRLEDPQSDPNLLGQQVSDTLGLYNVLERVDLSEQLLLAHLARIRRESPDDPDAELDSLHQLAGIYNVTDRFPEAEQIMRRVIDGARRTSSQGREVIPYGYLHDLGRFYLEQQRFQEALAAFEEVEPFYGRYYGQGSEHFVWIRTDKAIALHGLGRTGEAQALFTRNLEDSRSFLRPDAQEHQIRIRLDNYHQLAGIASDRGDTKSAERLIASALEEWQTSFRSRPFQTEEAQTAYALARRRVRIASQGSEALPAARVVTGWLDRATSVAGDIKGLAEDAPLRWAHALLPDVLWEAEQPRGAVVRGLEEEVFARLQSATADPAGDAMIQAALRQRVAATDPAAAALIDSLASLRGRLRENGIRFAEDLASGETALAARAAREQERVGIERELRSTEQTLRAAYPRFFDETTGTPVDLRSLQATLGEDEALLMIVPSEFGTHSVAITRGSAQWVRSKLTDAEASRLVRSLLWDLGAGIVAPPEELAELRARPRTSYDRASAHRLYGELVAPLEQSMRGKRHLFVVPSGAFTSLPFGVLVTEPPTGSDADPQALRQTRWLADSYALVQLPTVRSLRLLRSLRPAEPASEQPPASFVGFGDPLLPRAAEQPGAQRHAAPLAGAAILRRGRFRSGAPRADPTRIRALYSALPGTGPELDQLRATLGAPDRSLYLGDRAREGNLKELDLSKVRVIAFATHGALAGEMDGTAEPGLILTPPEEATDWDDGYLSASEVAGLRLDADWVILSACNTAAGGPLEETPGLSRLSRSFFSAGARNLLASLWPVADDAAPAITVSVFRLLREQPGISQAEALQGALRQVRSRTDARSELPWSHPGVWAPFILVGGAHPPLAAITP